ncbi:nucleotidyltransferase domain-containing protein [Curtobacterium luteum]|uniref:nucleotidyltransferase domain-containing protein n=1 Tax=Curtobacterium luteum TaxID=33881 RepID=UPI0007371CBA|nr:nucleotidyltransferase domain-containing protein [Curtobacterium luteum]
MDLTNPLASILADSQADALRVLARTDVGLTGRQIARLSGTAQHTTTKRGLDKLERIGLVSVTRGLQHSEYRANRDHVLWPAVQAGLDAQDELSSRIASFVARRVPDAISAAVFGSVARGEATAASDVDIVLVTEAGGAEDVAVELGDLVRTWTGNDCGVLDFSREQLETAVHERDPIVDSLRADARTVHGTELRTLL